MKWAILYLLGLSLVLCFFKGADDPGEEYRDYTKESGR